MTANNKRLNYNVPVDLAPLVRQLAAMDNQEPAYWIRKALERAVRERLETENG
jgi:hypothetical protein